jgi:hypothetical protein
MHSSTRPFLESSYFLVSHRQSPFFDFQFLPACFKNSNPTTSPNTWRDWAYKTCLFWPVVCCIVSRPPTGFSYTIGKPHLHLIISWHKHQQQFWLKTVLSSQWNASVCDLSRHSWYKRFSLFGTTYISFSYLQSLCPTNLKIICRFFLRYVIVRLICWL